MTVERRRTGVTGERFSGKVALVTGAAMGQGQSHAVRLAEQGANLVLTDVADQAETKDLVQRAGGRSVVVEADVRSGEQMRAAVAAGVAELGRIDYLIANAGVVNDFLKIWELSDDDWDRVIGINLTGVWQSCKAVVPQMIERGGGGSIVVVSSVHGLGGSADVAPYVASKHGVLGIMKTLALEVAEHDIRVNAVAPTVVNTPMLLAHGADRFAADATHDTAEEAMTAALRSIHPMSTGWVEQDDVSDAVLWLLSDEARFVTGTVLPVDAGRLLR